MASIATEYNWPDFQPKVRTTVKVEPAVLARYVGSYQLTPNLTLTFAMDGDHLTVQPAGQEKLPIFPESDTKFFLKEIDIEVEFASDVKGTVSYLNLLQGGQTTKAMKK